ncbi:porin [Colwellia sp. 12G3]|uniref:porin n=1 Tax=Colwellia sp. 12G3 TaxID=2058299 RepID=UPI0012FED207|nr:porin [Colwellia sp. 12G3]
MKNHTLTNKTSARVKTVLALAVATSLSTSFAHAQATANEENEISTQNQNTVVSQHTESSVDDAWSFADLYDNEQGDYLKLSGRLQLDSAWVDSDQGDFNDTAWRRFRFGFKGKYGDLKVALEADVNLNDSLDDAYNRLTDANVSWSLDKDTELKFLKQSTGFTLDGKTSSKKLLTPQRNNLTNNLWFTSEYFTGVSVKSKLADDWSYKTGLFSSDGSDEISISDASYFAMFSTAKKLAKNSLWDKGEISFDYVYNDTHEDGNTRDFSQIISTSSKFKQNDWGLLSDISWGKGDLGQSDIFGVVVMPTYQQNEKIQWVARYTYLSSSEDNGVRLGRYESKVVDEHGQSSVAGERGDKYQEVYAGVNWFVNDHKLKLQAGLQYAKMDDNANDGGAFDGWSFTVAMRSYW